MLKLIGIGLSWKDISSKGLEYIRESDLVFLEYYTSLSDFSVSNLESLIGKKINLLNRKAVEEEQVFLEDSKSKNVSLLVYGDPLAATTHYEIISEAKKRGVKVEIIHASSISSAIAETGLSLYRFGKIASIPFKMKGFDPKSFFEILKGNLSIDAHTLFLLDLHPEENKFLSVSEAINRLETLCKGRGLLPAKKKLIGCARIGTPTQIIKVGTALELKKFDFGKPPYCLVVPAELNFKEEEYLNG